MKTTLNWCLCTLLFLLAGTAFGQLQDEEYLRVITQRSDKIVATLGISDTIRYRNVRDILVGQYAAINSHHEGRGAKIRGLKAEYSGRAELLEEKRTQYEAAADSELRSLHSDFIVQLKQYLDPDQLDGVKNGMTYGVLPLTYGAYQDMIPSLTAEQKAKILSLLTEARELAMDEPGSREKHGVFGKFKGRINNYLSAEGYDLKAEEKQWAERRRK